MASYERQGPPLLRGCCPLRRFNNGNEIFKGRSMNTLFEKVQDNSWFSSIVCSLILGSFGVLTHNFDRIFPTDDSIENREIPLGELPTDEAVPATAGSFGEWVPLDPNVAYPAESDGFVAAYTHSDARYPVRIFVATDESALSSNSSTVTRAGRWDGTVAPVPEGNYFVVRAESEEGVTVRWLGINRE